MQATLRQRLDRSEGSVLEEGLLQDPLKLHKVQG